MPQNNLIWQNFYLPKIAQQQKFYHQSGLIDALRKQELISDEFSDLRTLPKFSINQKEHQQLEKFLHLQETVFPILVPPYDSTKFYLSELISTLQNTGYIKEINYNLPFALNSLLEASLFTASSPVSTNFPHEKKGWRIVFCSYSKGLQHDEFAEVDPWTLLIFLAQGRLGRVNSRAGIYSTQNYTFPDKTEVIYQLGLTKNLTFNLLTGTELKRKHPKNLSAFHLHLQQ